MAGPGPVPYPTLYGQEPARPKNTIEVVLYNIARLLGSVAAGYDVGLSNVMPYNPKMVAAASDKTDSEDRRLWYDPQPPSRTSGMYPHNTYHGHTPHHRTPLPLP